jgi:hypothetical protein
MNLASLPNSNSINGIASGDDENAVLKLGNTSGGITSLTLPTNLKYMGDYFLSVDSNSEAQIFSTNFTGVALPSALKTIGDFCLDRGATNLAFSGTKVNTNIPASVTSIGSKSLTSNIFNKTTSNDVVYSTTTNSNSKI